MRLVHSKQRSARRPKPPRIAISQAEITADLHYPAAAPAARRAPARPLERR